MGLFRKKPDPFRDRANDLERQIAELQSQIQQVVEAQTKAVSPDGPHPESVEGESIPKFGATPPRLRSTAHPHTGAVSYAPQPEAAPEGQASNEPVFEEMSQNPFRVSSTREQGQELGIRQDNLASFWQRLKNHFRGPVTSNPKLVNYLAAGSIQGLRPLRYERRVARNRFIALAAILMLILWGILALLLKR